MTTRASTMLFFLGGGPQGPSFLGIRFGSMVSIGVRPLLFGRTGQLVPPRLGLPLFGGFLLNEFQYVGVTGGRGGVTGARSAGVRLHFIEKPDPLFSFSRGDFDADHAARESNYRTWPATLSTGPTPGVLGVSTLFRPEITSRPTLALFEHRVRKTCLL